MRKFLVTGANGFVGRDVCRKFLSQGASVVAGVRVSSNFGEFVRTDFSQVALGNIGGNTNWQHALVAVDVVIHLAARVHVLKTEDDYSAEEFFEVNVRGTEALAHAAAAAGVKRFLFLSSIKVNGEHTEAGHVFSELDDAHPQDAYAVSKWQAEQMLQRIAQDTGMELVILRPPLVYGPGVKANFVKLLKLVDSGIPLPLANVQNSRSLVYVGNLVDALIACATHPTATGQTYLVSDGEDTSTPQLIRAVAGALNRPSRIFPMPITLMRGAARFAGKSAAIDRLIQSLVIDSSKIRNELGWQPPYTMAQGLQATAEWYRQSIQSGQAW